ncbi:hypothetical protein ABS71_22570 [bacterium SCN 62-11]|nr:hypothetical protein [Candidatus Eremiobacteraeota bacterium]ODT55819.1 MAG: hypothetical protein ABS71_22570 [bacterium SCN 62-11]
MIEHLEFVVHRLLELVGGWMCALAMTVVLALAALAFLLLNLFKFDRDSCRSAMRKISRTMHGSWGWLLTAALLLLQIYALSELHLGFQQRLKQQGKAQYVVGDEAGGGPTTQRAPKISMLESQQTVESVSLPEDFNNLEQLPVWSPEPAQYGGAPTVELKCDIVQQGKTHLLTRTFTRNRYVSSKLQGSDVRLKLAFQDPRTGAAQLYKADFQASYTFSNPMSEARRIHFSFPLPDNSGTLSNFRFRINGQEVPTPDIDQGLEWESELKPGEKCVAEVAYLHQGAKSWSYDVTGRREPIADFHLKVEGDRDELKFQRGSLYPSQVSSGKWEWDLKNQITSQSISLYFPYVPNEAIMANLFVFGPLEMVSLLALTLVWSSLRYRRVGPWRTALASLATCGAFALASYLVGYLPLWLSLLLAFALAGWLQWQTLGRSLWIVVLAAGVAPLTFLAPGHTGLLLTTLGLGVLTLAVRETCRREDRVA